MDKIPSDTTVFRAKKTAITGVRNKGLDNIKEDCDGIVLQFDGRDTKEAVLICALSTDGAVRTMPLEVIDFKSHPTGPIGPCNV